MNTLLDSKTACANYLNIEVSDLTQNGQDLFLVAVNQVRKMAELANDFEFSRKTVSVTVNGVTGGNLALAEDANGDTYEVKTVLEVGLLDTSGNLCPVEWTTVSESLTRQREDNMRAWPRFPRDGSECGMPHGGTRFTFSGDAVAKWPRVSDTDNTNFQLYLEAYTFHRDWTAGDLANTRVQVSGTLTPDATGYYDYLGVDENSIGVWAKPGIPVFWLSYSEQWILATPIGTHFWSYGLGTSATPVGTYTAQTGATGNAIVTMTTGASDVWTTHGQKYLLWATLVQLNYIFRRWVARQEGNLPPPAQLAEEGLQALIEWDAYRYEGFRTHNR